MSRRGFFSILLELAQLGLVKLPTRNGRVSLAHAIVRLLLERRLQRGDLSAQFPQFTLELLCFTLLPINHRIDTNAQTWLAANRARGPGQTKSESGTSVIETKIGSQFGPHTVGGPEMSC